MKNVKEIIKGIDLMMEGLTLIKGSLNGVEVVEKKIVEKAEKVVKKEVEEEVDNTDRKAELEEMSYNDIKALVSQLGGKAVGKKQDLIDLIIKLEGEQGASGEVDQEEDVEEEASNEEVKGLSEVKMRAEMQDFEVDELKDIAKEMKLKYKTKATQKQLIDLVLEDMEALEIAMDKLGYFEDDNDPVEEVEAEEVEEQEETGEIEEVEEIEEEERDSEDVLEQEEVIESLNNSTVEELADICSEYDLSSKGKKQALVDRIIGAIDDDIIDPNDLFAEEGEEEEETVEEEEVDVEEILDEAELSEIKEVAKELGIKVKKTDKRATLKKAILAKDSDDIMDVLVDLGLVEFEEEEDGEEEVEEIEVSKDVIKAEDKIEKDIRAKYAKKKLKDTQIKKFLEKYYEGDPDCSDCKGCSKEELLDCYIKVQRSLVDDDCEKHDLNDYYERGEVGHCCGRVLEELEDGSLSCPICGEEYQIEE